MSDKKADPALWSYVGKAGVLVALIWGVIQIFNYFFKTGEYEATANGSHGFYETSPIHNEAYLKNAEYKALVRTIIEKEGSLKSYNLDTLLKNLRANNRSSEKLYFDMYLNELGMSPYERKEYNSLWTFRIKNSGNKPLEELALELPFDGVFKVVLPGNVIRTNSFSNKIDIEELRPSYEANIYCWTNASMAFIEDDEEKSRFTHKNGSFSITYPVEVTGIYAWNKKNYDTPLLIGLGILAFLFLFIFAYGEAYGSKKMKEKLHEDKLSDKSKTEEEKDSSSKSEQ